MILIVYDFQPAGKFKIIFGDLNAKLGREKIYKSTTVSKSLHDESNDNGNKLISFVAIRVMNVI